MPPPFCLALVPAVCLFAWSPAALAAEAQGNFTSTSTFTCSGTGEFAGAEDLCEACDSDGPWDISVSPMPSPGSLAGAWSLFITATDYCPDEEPDPSPRELALAPFQVMQQGSALSASFLGPAVDKVGNYLGVTCSASCPAAGSCNVNCPDLNLSCTASCTPATEGCRDQFALSGTLSSGAIQATFSKELTVTANCPGFGTLSVVDHSTAQLTGTITTPEPQSSAMSALATLALLRGISRRARSSRASQ